MPIDPRSVGTTAGPVSRTWTERDTMLYALGVGCGLDELAFVTENSHGLTQRVLPTYGVVVGTNIKVLGKVGEFEWGRLVHGAQSLRVHRPLPPAGTIDVTSEITSVTDKGPGRNAVVTIACRGVDDAGELAVESSLTFVIKGEGGFGGDPGGPTARVVYPDRDPDMSTSCPTREDQALLYRLSGDRNPLHSDPWFAIEKAGFPRPILHGLCTFGFAGRALLNGLCGGDPSRLRAMSARFAAPVFPGEVLTTEAWRTAGARAVFRTAATQAGGTQRRIVLDDGTLEIAPRLPS